METTQLSSFGGTNYDYYFTENPYLVCEERPQRYMVLLDLQVTHKHESPSPACSRNQNNNIRVNIGSHFSRAFDYQFWWWPGIAWFERPLLDPGQDERGNDDQGSGCGKGRLR
jgi:hypothetical protein